MNEAQVSGRIELATQRLVLREFTAADVPFVLRLLNEPAFLRYIGDRGVRTPADALAYIDNGPRQSYRDHGVGLLAVVRRADAALLGMAGVMHKPWLAWPDLAYAFVPEAAGQGYALEAARAALQHARSRGVTRVVAVVTADNAASIRLLEKLGFRYECDTPDPAGTQLLLFAQTSAAKRIAAGE